MHNEDYEYRGLMAATWDLGRGDTSNWSDRFFFREVIERFGQPALDVGCGTGRLLLDYRALGIDIDGVDNSPEMLALCREKAASRNLSVTRYHQTMETLDLPRQYRTILVPSSSFQLLTEIETAREAMQRFYAHLLPDGALVMPFSFAWKPGTPLETDWVKVFEKARPEDGAVIRRYARERFTPDTQHWHSEDRYEVVRDGEVVASENHHRSPAGRWYSQAEAVQLFHDAGFEEVRALHEFSFELALPENSLFCVLGVKR